MKRAIALAALASLALVPATAGADGGKNKTLRGSFQLVSGDGHHASGKVRLRDGKRHDKLTVHVRRLAARTTYTYKLLQGSCGGTAVAGWNAGSLTTGHKGAGTSKARSHTFTAVAGVAYHVVVHGPDGQVVVCARLSAKAQPVQSQGKRDDAAGKDKSDHAPDHAEDKTRGKSDEAPGHAEDKTRGKSEDAPGHAEDKTRGKSEHAPGQAEDKIRGKSDDAPGHDKAKKPRH